MQDTLPVLIIGAGPTGLMMACQLARLGIHFRIIDKNAEPTKTTNAAGIQTRTLEIFDQMDIVDRFLEQGKKCHIFQIYGEKSSLATVLLNTIDSHYKYILMLPQCNTEKILTDYLEELKHSVERSVELINLTRAENKMQATVQHATGQTENIECSWIVGADGYHSITREKAGIPMTGSDINQMFFVADAKLKTNLTADAVIVFLNKGTLIGLFPLHENTYRIVANSNQINFKKSYSTDEINELVARYTHGHCAVTEIFWSSPFWIHSKLAKSMQHERVFIAGDAAHVHSPAGAQGMNTGLQDAYNLAWKLALVINHKANIKILDSYSTERYPIVKTIVKATETLARLALTKNPLLLAVRHFLIKYVEGKSRWLQGKVAMRITQLALNYRKSPIVLGKRKKAPKSGDLIIDVELQDGDRLFNYLRNSEHNLLLFTGLEPSEIELAEVQKVYAWAEQYPQILRPHIVSNKKYAFTHYIPDMDLAIHHRYGVKKTGLFLIRPDQYIGLIAVDMDLEIVKTYFKQWDLL